MSHKTEIKLRMLLNNREILSWDLLLNSKIMSLSLESPIVCQIPGCTTTQMEIEAELASFLNSFCAMCRKDRGGKLCSCAFPCSLTFKSQMLVKIHELLGLEKPPDRRAIQVLKENIESTKL